MDIEIKSLFMELMNSDSKTSKTRAKSLNQFEVDLGTFIFQAPLFKKTLVLHHLSKTTETRLFLFRILPKNLQKNFMETSTDCPVWAHLKKHYFDPQSHFIVEEDFCLENSCTPTKLFYSFNQVEKEGEHYLNVELTYSSKKTAWEDSRDEWFLVAVKDPFDNLTEDALVIRVSGARLLPRLTTLKTLNVSRIDRFSNSYNKLRFHQKSFDLSKVFLTKNKKLRSFLLRNNFINLKVYEKLRMPETNVSSSEQAPHLFGSFKNREQIGLFEGAQIDQSLMNRLVSFEDMNALKEHTFKDYKLKNLSACSFTFYLKLLGPFYLDKDHLSQIADFRIKENQILSIRIFMKRFSKKLSSEWPLARESLEKGVMMISYFP